MGYLRNPKKAAYNHIYNKTTVSVDKVLSENETNNKNENQNISWIIIIMFILFFILFIFFLLSDNEKDIVKEANNTLSAEEIRVQKQEDYINEFISKTNKKGFVESETTNKFVEMMKWCDKEIIYNKLFSEDLKEKVTLEQFEDYEINAFIIDYISAIILADDSIYISFPDTLNHKTYGVRTKDKMIIEIEQVE